MIQFVGSNYRYQGEKLSRPEIICVWDHHYNEETQSYPVHDLLGNSVCNPHDHIVVFDHVLVHEDQLTEYNLVCLPLFLSRTCQQFINQHITINWANKNVCFNFMINKPRLHREFLLVLLEHFKLTDYNYTLCWQEVTVSRVVEKYQEIFTNTKINIKPKQFLLGQENLLTRGLQYKHITNSENYQQFLQKNIFEPSCISLITEPAFYERETIITEKTIMAIYSGTIPIWVGGWKIPDYMRNLGFDVFDDLVDHSYQSLDNPWDRCFYAIQQNLGLLNNKDQLVNFIKTNAARFQHNLDLLKTNCFKQEVSRILKTASIDDYEKQKFYAMS